LQLASYKQTKASEFHRCLLSIAYCLLIKGQSAKVKEYRADFLVKWRKKNINFEGVGYRKNGLS